MKSKLILTICIITHSFSVSSQDLIEKFSCTFSSKINFPKELCEAFFELKEFYEYKEYIEEYSIGVKKNKDHKKPPDKIIGLKSTEDILIKSLERVKAIVVPTKYTNSNFATYNDLNSTDLSTRLNAYIKYFEYFLKYKDFIKEYEKLKTDLSFFKTHTDDINNTLNALSKILNEIFNNTGGGFTEFSTLTGISWLEIERTISRLNSNIRSELNSKLKNVNLLLESELVQFNNLKNNFQLLLNEQILYVKNNDIIYSNIDVEIAVEKNERKIKKEKLDKTKQNLQQTREKLISKQDEFLKTHEQNKTNFNKYESMVSEYNNLGKKIENMSFTQCPKKESFDKCNHTDLKNAYTKLKNDAIASYKEKNNKIESFKTTIETNILDYDQNVKAWEMENRKYAEVVNTYNSELTELNKLQEPLNKKINLNTKNKELNNQYRSQIDTYLKGIN